MTIVPEHALIAIVDGRQAILYRNTGHAGHLSLHEENRLTPKNLAGEGPSGSRPNEQTPRQADEATFAKQFAHKLFTMKEEGAYDALILAADPQTLGQLRDMLHKTVTAVLVHTLNKDLTHHTAAEIETALS